MTKLPQIKPQRMIKALKRMGFEVKRKSGSHFRLIHPDGRKVTIAVHNKPISKGTLNSITHQAETSIEEILKNLYWKFLEGCGKIEARCQLR
ncbi:MAG: type II toxin-antitoxin system HicA family toxin [Microgenomates group bacterium]